MAGELNEHYENVITDLLNGDVVPFLGAGVNLCGRPPKEQWEWYANQKEFLPDGKELAKHLATQFHYPAAAPADLLRVAQFGAVMQGPGPLRKKLRLVFDKDYPPTRLHQLLASLPALMRRSGHTSCYQLILTTNYDDLLERAFIVAQEPYDLVSYVAEGEYRGKFLHRSPDGKARIISKPKTYVHVSPEVRSVILKIHGAVERNRADWDGSYVITEDDYIDYLTRTDLSELVPAKLLAKLRNAHLLFLGYGLQDWNLRAILRRVSGGKEKLDWRAWAIQVNPDELDRKFWENRNVEIINARLEDYAAELDRRLQATSSASGAPAAGGAVNA